MLKRDRHEARGNLALKLRTSAVVIGVAFLISGCVTSNSSSSSVQAQIAVAESSLQSGDYEKGYRILNQVAATNPGSSKTMLALGNAYFADGAYLKARSFYQKALALGEKRKGTLGIARVQIAERDFQGANSTLSPLLKRHSTDYEALNMKGVIYDAQGQHDQAQAIYRQILLQKPDDAKAMNNLALSLMLSGQFEAAEVVETELYHSNKDDPRVRQNLALIMHLRGNEKQASALTEGYLTTSQKKHNFNSLSILK